MPNPPKFLLDANLSHRTAQYLGQAFGLDIRSLQAMTMRRLADSQVVELAQAQDRVIITQDHDFARLYYERTAAMVGIILLQLEDQSRRSIEATLDRFFRTEASTIDFQQALVVVTEHTVTIHHH